MKSKWINFCAIIGSNDIMCNFHLQLYIDLYYKIYMRLFFTIKLKVLNKKNMCRNCVFIPHGEIKTTSLAFGVFHYLFPCFVKQSDWLKELEENAQQLTYNICCCDCETPVSMQIIMKNKNTASWAIEHKYTQIYHYDRWIGAHHMISTTV